MTKRITLHTFRKLEKAEEAMLRAVMPRTSAADPLPLETLIAPRMLVRSVGGVRLVKMAPLTATFAEVANA